jgi:RNA polymerase sigma factor (TIGR02999 family)
VAVGESGEITQMVQAVQSGRRAAADDLLPVVYEQLRAIARQKMARERLGHTLQATALVHEAYARLIGNDEIEWAGRGHFYAAAAEAMRRILVEHARARARIKRGGPGADARRVPLSAVSLAEDQNPQEILSLDEAFRRLGKRAPEMADVVRLRFYAGLSVEETALALSVSAATVKRRWTWARSWLYREMRGNETGRGRQGVTDR